MALSVEDKKKIVSDVKEMAAEASSLVLADARGLTVSEATELRSEAHKAHVKFRVAKNTLVKLGLKDTSYEGIDDYLNGPTMLAFSYDEPGAAAKILKKFAKDNENLNIKGLSIDGMHLDASEIDRLATLPTFEEAISKFAGLLKAPLGKIASLMNEVPSKLARTLVAVKEQKS
ncbi:MAG: 50S ribosomal protein L10 [Gammaproteobacteria bacterium TMED219]|nr:MAG: 50S ribosomal protein L10 [Gammaproteobacteria bacterium TMED219]|tara:strand:+ start:2149 stop:2670 length:522 start_codon:yes stop_codon:yes gene_type:complete